MVKIIIIIMINYRRLVAKCANNYVIAKCSKALQPQQMDGGVSGEAEAAVHAARRLVSNLPSDHVIVKLDFSNASGRTLYSTQLLPTSQRFTTLSIPLLM